MQRVKFYIQFKGTKYKSKTFKTVPIKQKNILPLERMAILPDSFQLRRSTLEQVTPMRTTY